MEVHATSKAFHLYTRAAIHHVRVHIRNASYARERVDFMLVKIVKEGKNLTQSKPPLTKNVCDKTCS